MRSLPMTEEEAAAIECRETVSLARWPELRDLRAKLGRKAKQQKRFAFYSLYGHVWRTDTLWAAWETVRRNNGAPGVDGLSIEQISATPESVAAFIEAIQNALKTRTYQAQAVKRVYILKANGKLRPLGIPVIADRVVQAAVRLILEPIFEADFEECSYGFRPGRSAHDAIGSVERSIREGRFGVYDADLAGYFDSIPHDKLLEGVRQRVVDGAVLGLIRQWLKAPVVEPPQDRDKSDPGGGPPQVQRRKEGTPQGGVLSPLLANIHLHWFDRAFHGKDGPRQWANARLVRYADDFVILARYIGPEIQRWIEEKIESRLGLTINREKTRVIADLSVEGENLQFLGYNIGYGYDIHGRGTRYLRIEPSAKACKGQRAKVREQLSPKQSHTPLPDLIGRLNRQLRGWANYFRLGYPREAMRDMNSYVRAKLTWHLQRRSQRSWRPPKGQSAYAYFNRMGLIQL
jgi:RNA-directed DNA polymerase